MNGGTHKLAGVCTGVIASSFLLNEPYTTEKILLTGVLVGGSILGSLIPDIDHKQSKIGKKMKITSFIINKLCKHRGITHTPLLYMILSLILLLPTILSGNFLNTFYFNLFFGIFIGIISHLFLDSLTISGIPLLYPFTKKKFHLFSYSTNRKEYLPKILILLFTTTFLYVKLTYFI